MNIHTAPGSKIIFAHPNYGYANDIYKGNMYLTLNNVYTVERCEPHAHFTYVYLKEYPNVEFNSVQFDNLPE